MAKRETSQVSAETFAQERTRDELYEEAVALDVEGRSTMSKEELAAAVERARNAQTGVNQPREMMPHEADPTADPNIGQEQDNPTPNSGVQAEAPAGGSPAGTGTSGPGAAPGAAPAGGARR